MRVNVDVLRDLRGHLFDPEATEPEKVRRSLEGYLGGKLAHAPRRGKGARKRRFLRNCLATAKRARHGLYVCIGMADVDHTSNLIESLNGRTKQHLRRVAGRASTSGGPFESYGECLMPVVIEAKLKGGISDMRERLADVAPEEYCAARVDLAKVSEPARQRRSIARNPIKFLRDLVGRIRLAVGG
jgi:hypothetical protein